MADETKVCKQHHLKQPYVPGMSAVFLLITLSRVAMKSELGHITTGSVASGFYALVPSPTASHLNAAQ